MLSCSLDVCKKYAKMTRFWVSGNTKKTLLKETQLLENSMKDFAK